MRKVQNIVTLLLLGVIALGTWTTLQTFGVTPNVIDVSPVVSPKDEDKKCACCIKCRKREPGKLCDCCCAKCTCPRKPGPKPWGTTTSRSVDLIVLGGNIAPDGTTPLQVDFPLAQHIENIGSYTDGMGMCVMSSVEMGGLWANLEQLRGLRNWCAQFPGGGWPEKVDKQLKEFCSTHRLNTPPYIQYEGTDTAVLQAALKTGRFPAVTYSGDDKVRYQFSIAHMVCLAHLDENWACIWDNNGKKGELIWMTPKEFFTRWKGPENNGWAFVWLAPPPPPVPHN